MKSKIFVDQKALSAGGLPIVVEDELGTRKGTRVHCLGPSTFVFNASEPAGSPRCWAETVYTVQVE